MKRKAMSLIGLLLMVAMVLSLTGCNKKAATPEETTEVTQQTVDSPYELNMKKSESRKASLLTALFVALSVQLLVPASSRSFGRESTMRSPA